MKKLRQQNIIVKMNELYKMYTMGEFNHIMNITKMVKHFRSKTKE